THSSEIKIHCGTLQRKAIETSRGESLNLSIDKGHSLMVKGAPNLPSFSFSVQLPNHASGRVEIIDATFEEVNTTLITPSKGNISRDINPSSIPFTFGNEYQQNQFYPTTITAIQAPYIFRDFAGQSIQVFPVQYNPIQNKLRIYSDITLKVIYDQAPVNEHEQLSKEPVSLNEDFANIYANHFLNFSKKNTRYTPSIETGKMLILCPSSYLNSLKPFIEWKQRKGIQTIVVKTDTISGGASETNLKNFVASKYTELHFAYLLLVGDNMNIPPQNEFYSLPNLAGPSDIAYAYVSGNDHYPEFCVGRFSVENTSELDVQVAKVLHYEKTPNTAGNWMQTQIGVASEEGPGDDNQYDFEHIGVIVDSNKAMNLFSNQSELFDGNVSNGTYDAAGDPTAQMLADKINAGASLINYTGHGSAYGIVTTQFGNSEVSLLTNNDKLPFFLTVGCSPGQFGGQTCFAENLQRAGSSTTPYGSIANFMSSINQYWDEPMEAQDEFNAILRGAKPSNLKHRLGPLCVDACAQMNDA
ncbi:MAG TPA: C25 family cysteine peptidase, partial [Chitinophagaceae bacterium]|nr:C25 family cysteine peptidase [Chitinophagaceae bacterium]